VKCFNIAKTQQYLTRVGSGQIDKRLVSSYGALAHDGSSEKEKAAKLAAFSLRDSR
jgi:hypothetical protein